MVVIGAGRVGTALHTAAERCGVPCALVDRTRGWSVLDEGSGPVVVATRNDDLDAVLGRVPTGRRGDLVFVQNGMIRPWLARHHLQHATRALLFFAVPTRGAVLQPGEPCPVTGPHAVAVAAFLDAVGAGSLVVEPRAFAEVELEKLLWNCAFGLLCDVLDATVGEVVLERRAELEALVVELLRVGEGALGVRMDPEPLLDRLCRYSLSIADYRGAVKEWPWRNGWFVEEARRRGLSTPVHEGWLRRNGW